APGPRERLLALLPEAGDVPGLSPAAPAEHYTRDNLWVKLDGEAGSYTAYDCLQMGVRDYQAQTPGEKAPTIHAHVFDMGTPLLAFGLYGQLRWRQARPVKLGTAAAMTDTEVIFRQGRFSVSAGWPDE